MRRGKRPRTILLLMATVVVPALATGLSSAGTRVELQRDTRVPPDGRYHRLGQLEMSLAEGESWYLSGRVALRSTSNFSMLAKVRIYCREPEGAPGISRPYVWTTRNHQGRDAYKSLTLSARHLITATADGVYTCELSARSYKLAGDRPYLVALAGRTYLSGGTAPERAARRWALEEDYFHVGHVLDRSGILIGPSPGRRAEYLLRTRWPTDFLADEIKVVGDVEVTVCYYHTASCPSYAEGRKADRRRGAVMYTRLSATQLDAEGRPCAPAYRNPDSDDYRRTYISSGAHHQKIHHTLTAPISLDPSCTRDFRIWVRTRWGGPNPVRVEPRPYSIGIAMNRFPVS